MISRLPEKRQFCQSTARARRPPLVLNAACFTEYGHAVAGKGHALFSARPQEWTTSTIPGTRGRDQGQELLMHRLPYVIDNDRHKLADVLNQVLADHHDLAVDILGLFRRARLPAPGGATPSVGSLPLLLARANGQDLGLKPSLAACRRPCTAGWMKFPFAPEPWP